MKETFYCIVSQTFIVLQLSPPATLVEFGSICGASTYCPVPAWRRGEAWRKRAVLSEDKNRRKWRESFGWWSWKIKYIDGSDGGYLCSATVTSAGDICGTHGWANRRCKRWDCETNVDHGATWGGLRWEVGLVYAAVWQCGKRYIWSLWRDIGIPEYIHSAESAFPKVLNGLGFAIFDVY